MSPDPKAVLSDMKGGENVPSFLGALEHRLLLNRCVPWSVIFPFFSQLEMLMSTEDSKSKIWK